MSLGTRTSILLAAVVGGGLLLQLESGAQEKKASAKQKDAVIANLKKADLSSATVVETKNFLIATTLPKDKAKALGTVLEKVAPVARKAVQVDEKDLPWKGKLAVYCLPENRDFKSFIRNVVVDQPEGVHYELRSDTPYIVDPVELQGKTTEANRFANTAALIATAYLKGKAGIATLPSWLMEGFGRVTVCRSEGSASRRYRAYRLAARSAAQGGNGIPAAKVSDLWAEEKPANADVVADSVADYLAYGPGKENFAKLLAAFRPNQNGTIPTAAQAFEAAGWKDIPKLEAAWRKWAITGR